MRRIIKRTGYVLLILFVLLNVMTAFHAYNFTKFYDSGKAAEKFDLQKAGLVDKTKALLFGVKSYKMKVDSIPFGFNVVHLKTSDSISLEAWESIDFSDSKPSIGTAILFHGHGGNKLGVMKEARGFLSLGYSVLMVDFRAHGNSEGNICTIGYDESKDVKAAYDYVMSKDEPHIILWGTSLGAAAGMKALYDYNLKPSALILEMPFGSLHETVKARCRILGVPQEPISALLTFWGGVERGFNGFNHNPEDYAKKIDCPVLLQWGVNDNRVSKKETATIYTNIKSSDKSLIEYLDSGHQSFCGKENEKWVRTVAIFLSEHLNN